MKLFSLIIVLFVSSKCFQNEVLLKVEYKAETRGALKNITVTKNDCIYKTLSKSDEFKTSTEDWQTITKLVKGLNLEILKNLEAPSSKSHIDAAMQASITITFEEKIIESANFDDGNPPEELKKLVEKLLEITTKSE